LGEETSTEKIRKPTKAKKGQGDIPRKLQGKGDLGKGTTALHAFGVGRKGGKEKT